MGLLIVTHIEHPLKCETNRTFDFLSVLLPLQLPPPRLPESRRAAAAAGEEGVARHLPPPLGGAAAQRSGGPGRGGGGSAPQDRWVAREGEGEVM